MLKPWFFLPATPYANRDPRLSATVTLPSTLYNGSEVTADRYPEVGGYVLKKYTVFPDEEFGGDPSAGFSDNDVMVLRYGEILLNYAEAQNEATGPDASVYDALNQLRNRAGVAEVTPGLSPEEMRQVIRLSDVLSWWAKACTTTTFAAGVSPRT